MRVWILAVTMLAMAGVAAAQDAPLSPLVHRSTPDFLFGRPSGSVAVRGSWLFARAGSDWYSFVTDQLTLDKRDFNAPGIAADVGITLSDRLEAIVGADYSRANATSEYRKFVDNNRQPINQTTRLQQASITGGLKFALVDRGRAIGSLAWIPKTVVPYVEGGGGAIWYGLQQAGDFVDFTDFSVFTDVFESKGWAPTAHAGAGVDIRVARRIFATVDARYRWASAKLSQQWVNFAPVDLAGLRVSAGINVPF